jgi:protein-L-isoaspartate(D-aspartate) O-methyltransferase
MNSGILDRARFNMIEQQIRPWEVLDQRVLDTLGSIPREQFVPAQYAGLAYADIEIPLAHGRKLQFPRVEGRLLQALAIGPEENILEIGTGCGHLTACLARLGGRVTSVDCHQDFLDDAARRLQALGLDNVSFALEEDLGSPSVAGPFDAIAVTAALHAVTDDLKAKLNRGGRLFAITGAHPVMEALLITRTGESEWQSTPLFETECDRFETAPRERVFEF